MRVVIIGAGAAGLATAALLAAEGHSVTVLERHARVGGRAGGLWRDGFRFDTGPSWYLMPRVFEHFFNLLGTSAREELNLVTLDPGYRVFLEPQPSGGNAQVVDVPHSEARAIEVFDHLEPGAGEQLSKYLGSARDTLEMAEKYFLYNPFTSARSVLNVDVLRRMPKLVGLLGRSLEKFIERRFQNPALQQILGYPAVFLGTHPGAAPAMYHLMSALDLDDGVHYPMGGFWGLIEKLEALAQDAGARFITRAEAESIATEATPKSERRGRGSKARRVRGVYWRDANRSQRFLTADVVVSAADLHHTETQLLAEPDRSYPQKWWDKRQSGPGAVLTFLGVRGELEQLPHHSLFFTRDWHANFDAIFGSDTAIPSPASTYVCKASATDSQAAPSGFELLFILTPVPADESIGTGGADGNGSPEVEEISQQSIDQLAKWADIPDLNERIISRNTIGPADFARDYSAWSAGMLGPSHTLGQSAMFRAQNRSKKVAGLLYAGASTAPGIGVPMCLISAELVLKHLRGDASPGPLPLDRRPGAFKPAREEGEA